MKGLGLEERVQRMGQQEVRFSIKDHKEGFPTRVDVRLLNLCKTEVGRISQQILRRVIKEVKPLWINTAEALEWFRGLEVRRTTRFLQFDVVSFYPSITKEILGKAL